ncbi:unnamed protein product [Rhizophagus irregularis]|nr:unnamed protein product [Rhizophagus irregularis]
MDTRSNLSSEYENDKVEVDDDNNVQNMSFDSIGSAISEMSLEDKVEVEVEDDDDNNDSEKYSSEMDTRSNLSSEYENDKVEVDDDNNVQNMSFDSIGSAISEMSLEDI